MIKKFSFIFFACFIIIQTANSQHIQLSDSSQISLLTNTPSDIAVYSVYGHTAIRIEDPVNNIDVIINYGIFDFDSPNFLYRFVKGKADFAVVGLNSKRYLYGYSMNGIGIIQQNLNLTLDEKQKIWEALNINCLPENRIYRYNYFYDNCSTRPRDIIEQNMNGTIVYTPTGKKQSFRDLIHECVQYQPWLRFGIDLVIGSGADKEINDRQKDFLPLYLKDAFTSAIIQNSNGSDQKLVTSENWIVEPSSDVYKYIGIGSHSVPFNTPLLVCCIILIIAVLISVLNTMKKWLLLGKIFDFLLFFVAGIAGCIIFFLMFFSEHPCVDANWNIIWLNPLQFAFSILFLIKFFSKSVYYYHFINFVALTLFVLAWFLIPQHLELAFLPCILALAIRSGTNIILFKKNKTF